MRKYVIMCGGYYEQFQKPKALHEINGESLVERTIRLLNEEEINNDQIFITADDERFESLGVEVLHHENSYRYEDGKMKGYWLDAFYPHFEKDAKVTFLYGDVYYTKRAIWKIIKNKKKGNILFGSAISKNPLRMNWGEPFAYRVDDYSCFLESINKTKKLYDEKKTIRHPITWELYRVENGLDVNVQRIKPETFATIEDLTRDIDSLMEMEELEKEIQEENKTVKVESIKRYFDYKMNAVIPPKRIFTVTKQRAKELKKAGVIQIIEEG